VEKYIEQQRGRGGEIERIAKRERWGNRTAKRKGG